MNDDDLDASRAEDLIADAQTLCEGVVSPLPGTAAIIIKRIAARAYVTTITRVAQAQAAGSPFAAAGAAGVWLSPADIADLRRMSGTGGAFTIGLLPADYVAPVPPWLGDSLGTWDMS
jgi:hypothetical protein